MITPSRRPFRGKPDIFRSRQQRGRAIMPLTHVVPTSCSWSLMHVEAVDITHLTTVGE